LGHLIIIAIIITACQRTYLRECALSIESSSHFAAKTARSAAYSALASPAVAGVQAPRKHAAAVVVNLQQLEGSQASRQPAEAAKHALSIESAVVVDEHYSTLSLPNMPLPCRPLYV